MAWSYWVGVKGRRGESEVGEKMGGPDQDDWMKGARVGEQEVGGRRGVAVKCIDGTQNPGCEGSMPGPY